MSLIMVNCNHNGACSGGFKLVSETGCVVGLSFRRLAFERLHIMQKQSMINYQKTLCHFKDSSIQDANVGHKFCLQYLGFA